LDPPVPPLLHRRKRLSPLKELVFPLFDLVGVHVKLLGQFHQRLLAPDGGKRHLCLESRAVVPARSSRHGLSCSRHLSRSQAEIPLILAVQISPSQVWLSIASLCFVTVRRAMLMPVSFSQATISSSESTSEASAAILALMRWRMRERFPGGDDKSAEAR